jgi:hypothetical protein
VPRTIAMGHPCVTSAIRHVNASAAKVPVTEFA